MNLEVSNCNIKFIINLEVANCDIKLYSLSHLLWRGAGGEVLMLTFKSATMRLDNGKEEEELF